MRLSNINICDALHADLEHETGGNTIKDTAELFECVNLSVSNNGPRVAVIGRADAIMVVDGNEVPEITQTGAQRMSNLSGAVNQ